MAMVKKAKIHPKFKQEPYWNVIDANHSRSLVREMINSGGKSHERGVLLGEMLKEQIHPDGGLRYIPFPERKGSQPIIREMINTSQGQMALLEKVRIDVAFGLAETPLLYEPIYERIAPAGGFPGGMFQIDDFTLQGNVVFLEKFEGGEVEFGALSKGQPQVGTIQTYAAGFEWTEEMIEYDRTWSIEQNNRAFGRAYNALLNHLHLSPIIGFSYQSANTTPANPGSTAAETAHLTIQDMYATSVTASPRRTGTVLLASEADRFTIEAALLTPVNDAQGNPLPNVPVETIIYYDGDEITVGEDTYTYPGVTPGDVYLIMPKRKMKELVHHDLRIDIGPPDISRLIEGQQVGRTRRSVFAAIEDSVEKGDIYGT